MRGIGCGVVIALAVGCSGGGTPATDGGAGDASVIGDAGPGHDAATIPGSDAGPGVDAGVMPEVCTGGLDEDGDARVDCADDDCWTFAACIAADVAAMVPSLVACGDAIEIDAEQSASACAAIGMPMGSTYPTDCAAGTLTATARVFCGDSGAPAALWIEERLDAPETTTMLSARQFEHTYFERASVVDWERQVSGPSTREGGSGFPLHETQDRSVPGTAVFHIITIRPVAPGDTISRLVGMQHITSLVDLDQPMSMDTRSTLHMGGLTIVVPAP